MDSNYEHVAELATGASPRGHRDAERLFAPLYRHARDLLVEAAYKEVRKRAGYEIVAKLKKLHKANFEKTLPSVKVLPGAAALLKALTRRKILWGDRHGWR